MPRCTPLGAETPHRALEIIRAQKRARAKANLRTDMRQQLVVRSSDCEEWVAGVERALTQKTPGAYSLQVFGDSEMVARFAIAAQGNPTLLGAILVVTGPPGEVPGEVPREVPAAAVAGLLRPGSALRSLVFHGDLGPAAGPALAAALAAALLSSQLESLTLSGSGLGGGAAAVAAAAATHAPLKSLVLKQSVDPATAGLVSDALARSQLASYLVEGGGGRFARGGPA